MSSDNTAILEDIIEGCKSKEQSSQRRLYELYSKRMVSLCMRYTGDYDTARDLMHDGFIKTFNSICDYKGYGSFEGWLRRIFVNLSIDYVTRQMKKVDIDSMEHTLHSTDNEDDTIQGIDIEEIYAAIKQLPDIARTIFNMFNLDGYTIQEIADKLNMSNVAVRSQHSRAKERLRQILTIK